MVARETSLRSSLQGLASKEFLYLVDRAANIARRVFNPETDFSHGLGLSL
jgi:hypothetical protein